MGAALFPVEFGANCAMEIMPRKWCKCARFKSKIMRSERGRACPEGRNQLSRCVTSSIQPQHQSTSPRTFFWVSNCGFLVHNSKSACGLGCQSHELDSAMAFEQRIADFNAHPDAASYSMVVSGCISCHQKACPGPLERIAKRELP